MSFLSDYGAEPNSIPLLIGDVPNVDSTVFATISIGGNATNVGNTSIAKTSSNTVQGTFTWQSGNFCSARGWRSARILGNGQINCSTGTGSIDLRGTKEVRNIGPFNYLGSTQTISSTAIVDTQLTAFYDLNFVSISGNLSFTLAHYPNLATVTCRNIYCAYTNNHTFHIRDAALTAQSVENILVAFDNGAQTLAGGFSGNINLSGGTSSGASALTTAAAAARSSLISKSYTVTLNP